MIRVVARSSAWIVAMISLRHLYRIILKEKKMFNFEPQSNEYVRTPPLKSCSLRQPAVCISWLHNALLIVVGTPI